MDSMGGEVTAVRSGISRLEPRREVLGNGLVFLWNRTHDTPSVAIRGSFPAGAAREAPERAGLASFTARLLRRGTELRSAQEISAAVEDVGASFAVWAGTEEAGFSAKCLDRDVDLVLDVLQEVLERPAFAEGEIAKTRGEILTQLREQEDSTSAQAGRALMRMLYPESHPYARSAAGVRETVEALGREDFRDFHAGCYSAAGMKVSVAGALDSDAVRAKLEGWFTGRDGGAAPADWSTVASGTPQHARIPMPHKSQVDLLIAGPGVPRRHPDYFALSMVNLILGGFGLMGRLGERVRDEQGMAYHVSCRSSSHRWAGEWIASAGVGPQNLERATEAILAEVERIRREPVTEVELEDARSYLVGSLPLRMETDDGIASYLLTTEYYDLGLDYVSRYPGYVRAESRESLLEAARRHMDPAHFSTAAAGPL